ncbi:zinc finger domain-containing protein [Streptomyces roseolus]|uniref:zinc finger domain-containing protein n=1 Tax=Streptomyces roseolus TaxID=67358 RepID=UPI0037BA646E
MTTTLTARRAPSFGDRTADAVLDAAYETQRLYGHGAFGVPCPACGVPAGALCLARRSVHAERRGAYRQGLEGRTLVPPLVGRSLTSRSTVVVRP